MSWVTRRSKCNLNVAFESLRQLADQAVREMNDLPSEDRRSHTFSLEESGDDRTEFIVLRDDGLRATFRKSIEAVRIHFASAQGWKTILVFPEWDGAASRCHFRIGDDRESSLDRVCETALRPMFFDLEYVSLGRRPEPSSR